MRIAVATRAHLDALERFEVWVVAAERQREILRESVASGGCYVAECEGSLAGFITWDHGFFNRPFVRLLAVAAPYRRRHIGRALLARVESAATTERELFVSTEERNGAMRAMLAAAAYDPSGSIEHLNEPGNAELLYYKRL